MEELSLADYLAVLKRWKKYFLATFFVLMTLSTLITLSWSNYRSSATIEIEQPQVAPTATTAPGVNPDEGDSLADLRISRLEEKVTSPASLIEIITKYNLYPHARNFNTVASVAARMQKKVKLDLISSTVANPAAANRVSADQLSAIAFTISFDYSDPQIARQIDSELVTRFLDEDLKQRRLEAESTSEFLGNQIAALEESLADQEKKIAAFESEHGISGPAALMFNQQAVASTSANMQSLDSQIASNEGTQGSVRAQLSTVDPYSRVIADGQVLTTPAVQLKALEAQYTTLTAQYGPEHPDVVRVRNQIAALRGETGATGVDTAVLKSQIKDVQTNLDATQKTEGPDNPDVLSLKRQLESLQGQLASAGNGASHAGLKQDADNPAYLALVSQLDALQEQHKALIEQRTALSKQQMKYEEAVAQDPALEEQMATLARDHDNAEKRHSELKERKMAADMEVKMIEDHQGERLTVISPADLPDSTYPKRSLLFIGGFLVSLLGGLMTVVVAQQLNASVIGSRHLTALAGAPPLVVIPHLYTPEEKSISAYRRNLDNVRDIIAHGRRLAAPHLKSLKGDR